MHRSALELANVSKSFGGVAALSNVNFSVEVGEVHGLLGQNGSGKSTLIKILGGYHAPDSGRLTIQGEDVDLPLLNSQSHGIAIIHQDLGLVDSMSVLENIGIADGYGKRTLASVNWRSFREEVGALLRRIDSEIDPDTLVGRLRPTDKSIVAIARAIRLLSKHADKQIFVLDEPTAYLGPAESDRLMAVMRKVAAEGSSVIFVSHKLGEVLAVTDRCTILRDGKVVDTIVSSETTAHSLVNLQLGRELGEFYPPLARPPRGKVVLGVEGLELEDVRDFNLKLRHGEILGITGLAGMGQDEIIQAIGGARNRHDGHVFRDDGRVVGVTVREALAAGVAMVPADRKGEGLWLDASARENFTLPATAKGPALRVLDEKAEKTATVAALKRVGARPLASELAVGRLSGGNQQKVLMAKWLSIEPDVLLLHEPTQGVDAAARREILGLVAEAANAGTSVIVCSTDYEQLSNICHRVLTLRHGVVTSELTQPFNESDLLLACQGSGSTDSVVPSVGVTKEQTRNEAS